jgi:hypothetical protein
VLPEKKSTEEKGEDEKPRRDSEEDQIPAEQWETAINELMSAMIEDSQVIEELLKDVDFDKRDDRQNLLQTLATKVTKAQLDALMTNNGLASHGCKKACLERLTRFSVGL